MWLEGLNNLNFAGLSDDDNPVVASAQFDGNGNRVSSGGTTALLYANGGIETLEAPGLACPT